MNDTVREAAGYCVPIAWICSLVVVGGRLGPVGRFVGATVGLLFAIKVGSWLVLRARSTAYSLSPVGWLLFWTVWPGVRPDRFAGVGADDADPDGATFVEGYLSVMVGLVLAVAALLSGPVLGVADPVASWLLLFGVLGVVHFGVGRILPFALRWAGYPAPALFDAPLRSRGVGDFWSVRWNRPFVEMDRLFVTRPLAPRIGVGGAAAVAFLVSGALHELAISYTAGAGWGGPAVYFLVQGGAYTAEKRWFPDVGERPVLARAWTYLVVLAPLPLLFHAPFRATYLVPVVEAGRSVLLSYSLETVVGVGLWLGAGGHFLVLAASYRVPDELDWDTDLESLQPLNRKLLWTYGGYVVMLIVAFGVMTAVFHEQFLEGTPVALGLCGLITCFWTVRLLVDAVYFDHDDWPEGLEFVVGHAMLTSLFLFLVAVYAGTILYHVG